MKRLITFTLALMLTISLAACSDSSNTPNSSTNTLSASPIIMSPDNPLQGDAGSPAAGDDGVSFGQAISPSEDDSHAGTADVESISVDITATNAYVLNTQTDSVLYEKNSDEHIAPASTAKMLTALTVLDYCPTDDTFTVGAEIDLIASDSSRAWLNKGDKLTVKQLLIALLLPSGNDAAYTLAVNAGKQIADDTSLSPQQAVKAFVGAMNQKAEDVGAASSNFVTPDGYDADGQYTTAYDLAQIAKECLASDTLSEIMGSYKITETLPGGREVTYTNTNELINPNSQYYYPGAVGLKTGSTGDAGSCLVSAASIDGQTYICVVMGSSAGIRFTDSLTVFHAIDPAISLPQVSSTAPASAPGGMKRP